MTEPIVYFKPGCPFGIRLRIALTVHRIPHSSVRFRDDEAGAARVRAVTGGNEISPTVRVGDRWLTNPTCREVRGAVTETRRTWTGYVAPLLVAAVLLLAGCGSDDATADESPSDESSPVSAPASETLTSEGAASDAPTASPLEGTWQAGPITLGESEATVRRHGLGRWVDDYRANAPFSGKTVLSLTIENGAWDLYGASDGGQPEPIDYDAEYEIDGDTVTFHHSDGSTTYRWTIEQDTLTLDYATSTMPAYQGIPDEVFQRALYMTATFTRAG